MFLNMGKDGPNNFYNKIKGKKNTHITYYEMRNTEPLLQSIGSKFYPFIQSAFDSGLLFVLRPFWQLCRSSNLNLYVMKYLKWIFNLFCSSVGAIRKVLCALVLNVVHVTPEFNQSLRFKSWFSLRGFCIFKKKWGSPFL